MSKPIDESKGEAKDLEFTWNVYDFPKQKKTEEIKFDWGEEKSAIAPTEAGRDSLAAADRFFSFHAENEAFQEQLDAELSKMPLVNQPVEKDKQEFAEYAPVTEAESASWFDLQTETKAGSEPKEGTEAKAMYIASEQPEPGRFAELEAAPGNEPAAQIQAEPDPGLVAAIEAGPKPVAAAPKAGGEPEPAAAPKAGGEPEPAAAPKAGGEPEPDAAPKAGGEPDSDAPPEAGPDSETGAGSNIPLWFEQDAEPEKKKKGGCLKRAVLVLIILFLAAEVAALSIKYFWPDSPAAATVARGQIAIVKALDSAREAITGLLDKIGGDQEANSGSAVNEGSGDPQNSEPDPKEPADIEPDPAPDPAPAADKAALVASMLSHNKNIETVRANEDLAYEAGRDYGVSDVNDSSPLEYNILETGKDGSFLYIDQEITAALIAFDSQWIDYVNDGVRDVIGLTKKDSRAYRNVSTYSKVGKVKQSFLLLEIGELRKGENGYYAWTYEKIREKAGAKTSEKTYRWIYYLEPQDGSLKIVDYFSY